MSRTSKSPGSEIRQALDDSVPVQDKLKQVADVEGDVQKKYEQWLVSLRRRYPTMSEKKLKERAAELACLNRKDRRRVFKHTSMKLSRLMKIPKGK